MKRNTVTVCIFLSLIVLCFASETSTDYSGLYIENVFGEKIDGEYYISGDFDWVILLDKIDDDTYFIFEYSFITRPKNTEADGKSKGRASAMWGIINYLKDEEESDSDIEYGILYFGEKQQDLESALSMYDIGYDKNYEHAYITIRFSEHAEMMLNRYLPIPLLD